MADEITGFQIQLDGGEWQSVSHDWIGGGQNAFQIRLDGLQNGQSYGVRVRALNANGASHPSNRIFGTPVAIERATPIITQSVAGHASAQIFWQYIPGKAVIHNFTGLGESVILEVGVENTGNLPITGWEYTIRPHQQGQWQSVPAQGNQIHIAGLNPNAGYFCKVRATNAMGTGIESEELAVTTGSGQAGITGGDDIYEITVGGNQYRVHEFHSSGQLTIAGEGMFEWLAVAGGGGGGYARGGGGGGGGVLERSGSLSAGTYMVVVGEGGEASTDPAVDAKKGGDTSFAGETAVGGGFGGTSNRDGGSGGSGGGSGQTASAYPGEGILGQGSDGEYGTNYYGKRGGGAANPNSTNWTINGRVSSITGQDVEYGRGGGSNAANGGARRDKNVPGGEGADQ